MQYQYPNKSEIIFFSNSLNQTNQPELLMVRRPLHVLKTPINFIRF